MNGLNRAAACALAAALLAPVLARADADVDVRGQAGAAGMPSDAGQINAGPTYGVAVGFGTRQGGTGMELGYSGATMGTDGLGNVVFNGVQGLLLTGPAIGIFHPYVTGGYQMSWTLASSRARSADVAGNEMIQGVPVGGGLDVVVGHSHSGDVILGARGLYQFVWGSNFIGNGQGKYGDDQLSGTVVLGGAF